MTGESWVVIVWLANGDLSIHMFRDDARAAKEYHDEVIARGRCMNRKVSKIIFYDRNLL
jgi:hypothetical protein